MDQDIGLICITKFFWEWFKMSQMMVAVFSWLWFIYYQYVLHSSHSRVIRVTLLLSFFSGQVEVVSCSYISVCCFVCCAEWHMWVLCRLIVYFIGGQLVFAWDRLEDFLITHERPVGNKVTNTISHAKVDITCPKIQCTIAFDAQTQGKVSVTPKSWLPRNSLPS